jgi:hypothetical protein
MEFICLSTISLGIGKTEKIFCVFWTVIAVMAVHP